MKLPDVELWVLDEFDEELDIELFYCKEQKWKLFSHDDELIIRELCAWSRKKFDEFNINFLRCF